MPNGMLQFLVKKIGYFMEVRVSQIHNSIFLWIHTFLFYKMVIKNWKNTLS